MKSIKFAAVAIGVLVFSGCSLASQKAPTGPITFTFSQSLWKSADDGTTWEVRNKGLGKANTTNISVLSMAVNPYDGNSAYVGLRSGGIMETKDGGDTWSFINFQSEKVYGLALDPVTGRTLYASGVWQGTGKLFKTEDDGATWKEIYTSPSAGPLVISLMIDKKNPSVLYVTTSDNQVLKSVDAGTSWKNIYAAPDPVLKIVQDVANENLLYALTTSGNILRSKDGGANFEEITSNTNDALKSFGSSNSAIVEADPSVANRVYLAGSAGILVSDDAGNKWRLIPTLNKADTFPVKALAINPQNPKELICGAAQAIYKSVDGGNNWSTFQFDNKMALRVIKYDSNDPTQLYLGFDNN